MNTKDIVLLAAKYADDKKAENLKIIDLGGLSSLCDYIIIATATSKPHLDAIEEEISMNLKKEGIYKSNRDGGESNRWRVSDYGAFLVHIMTQEARDFYALDKIFSFGKLIDLNAPVQKKTAAKKTSVKKTAVKKSTKKTAPKKATVKKTVKKAAPKKATAKKSVTKAEPKKPLKKTTGKKTIKNTAAKTTPKKATKKAAKSTQKVTK